MLPSMAMAYALGVPDYAPSGIKEDDAKAQEYAEAGVKQGNACSANLAGEIELDRYYSEYDDDLLKSAEKHFIFAYDRGWPRALYNIARLHWEDSHTFEDKRFAILKRMTSERERRGRPDSKKYAGP